MTSLWLDIATFLGVFTLAILSPGPNFILVTNSALNDSRKDGMFTALGVATGSGLFALAGLAGVLSLVQTLPYFSLVMRFAGGGYLAWLGIEMMRKSRLKFRPETVVNPELKFSPLQPYKIGILTNLTNPKAWAFYLSLFALLMKPDFSFLGKAFLSVSMFLISLTWYSLVAVLISNRSFQPFFFRLRPLLQQVLGLLLLLLGSKILLA